MEKMPSCRAHPDAILVSKIENHTGKCLNCIEFDIARIADLEVKNHELDVELDQLRKRVVEADQKVALFQSFMRAETEGTRAAMDAMPENQNPYEAGTEQCVMWLNGWQAVETRRQAAKAMSVVTWAITNLSHVEELAAGYGLGEIKEKVGQVVSKLEPFAPREG